MRNDTLNRRIPCVSSSENFASRSAMATVIGRRPGWPRRLSSHLGDRLHHCVRALHLFTGNQRDLAGERRRLRSHLSNLDQRSTGLTDDRGLLLHDLGLLFDGLDRLVLLQANRLDQLLDFLRRRRRAFCELSNFLGDDAEPAAGAHRHARLRWRR